MRTLISWRGGGTHKHMKGLQKAKCGRPLPAHSEGTDLELQECQARLRTYLTKAGLKFTEQRWNIAKLILSTGGHLSAQELVEQVRRVNPGIGPATVYRTIKVLCDADVLKESLSGPSGTVYYEAYYEKHHDHIVCMDCGEIFEFNDEQIESRQKTVSQKMDFEEDGHRHVIFARCALLKRKR